MNELLQDEVSEAPVSVETSPEQEVVTPEQENSEKAQESYQERNWKAARSKLEEQNYQIQLLRQELEAVRQQAAPQQPEEDKEEEQFTESERKLYREIKNLKGEIHRTKAKQSDSDADRLRARFPDFDAVMNPENIQHLRVNNPSLAKALSSLKDEPYEQGLAAYEALRNTSWYKNSQSNPEEKMKLEQNQKKPLSVQAVKKQGALNDANRFANGLTPELKKALIKEMSDARKGS
jgi:hypothetical protein